MNVIVSGKNLEVSEGLKEYVEKKIGKLDRYLPSLTDARVEFALEKTKSANQREVVQVTLRTNGTILRGEERASDFGTAVDIVVEKLEKADRAVQRQALSRPRSSRAHDAGIGNRSR